MEKERQKLPELNTEDPREIVNSLCNRFLADVAGNAYFHMTHLDLFNSFQKRFRKLKGDLVTTKQILPRECCQPSQGAVVHSNDKENFESQGIYQIYSIHLSVDDSCISKYSQLNEVRQLLKQMHGPALPAYIPPEAVTYLMKAIIFEWSPICLEFFEGAKEDAKELVSKLCKLHFSSVQSMGLSAAVRFVSSII